MKNILYYKYVQIEDVEAFQKSQYELCASLKILGKILLAEEGINGCITGSEEAIEKYKQAMWDDPRFADLEFKEGSTAYHNFKKLIVRPRPEILSFGQDVSLDDKAPYIEPEELKELLDNDADIVLFDVRNDYESDIGHFKNAVPMDTETFRELPDIMKNIEKYKDKEIVTYCTGGIRCEKATAYLKQQGFNNIRQLHGGIIRYGEKVGNDHWEGKCFVFDNRGAIEIDPKDQTEPITQCTICSLPTDDYHNCSYVKCDKRFIACAKCIEMLEHCCSKRCRNHARDEEKRSACVCAEREEMQHA